VFHKFVFFYPNDLKSKPEFMYTNKNQNFSEKEVNCLLDHLKEKEAAASKKNEEDATNANAAAAKGGKADPKKDAKGKAGGKGAPAGVEDKNSPQQITVDYPADVENDKNYLIIER